MKYILLRVGNEEHKLALTTARQIDAEKALGYSLAESMEHTTEARVFPTILWAANRQTRKDFSFNDACRLVDKMSEEGYSWDGKEYEELGVDDRAIFIYDILRVSGFFTKAQIQEIDEALGLEEQKTSEESDLPLN